MTANADSSCSHPAIGASFYQPTHADVKRPTAYWREHFARLRALGIDTVYLQWAQYGDDSLWDAQTPSGNLFVQEFVHTAAELGIGVMVGLHADPEWGQRIQQSPEAVTAYLRGLRHRSVGLARAIAVNLARDAPLGWYLPEEIDDINWHGFERQRILLQHLRETEAQLATLGPWPVAVSTFITGALDAVGFAEIWQQISWETRLWVLLQDGAGTDRIPRDEFAHYLDTLTRLLSRRSDRLAVIIELFEQEPDEENTAFRARPARFARIDAQVGMTRRFGISRLIAFTYSDYVLGSPTLERDITSTYCRRAPAAQASAEDPPAVSGRAPIRTP